MVDPANPISTLEPSATTWAGLIAQTRAPGAERARNALGLPAGTPLVATGHQAGIWHAGIVAKAFAAAATASRVGGRAVWLIVDQDDNDPTRIRYPREGPHGPVPGEWNLAPRTVVPQGTPTGSRSALSSIDVPTDAHPRARPGALRAIADALRAHADQPTLALQFAHAMRALVEAESGPPGDPIPVLVTTTDLVRGGALNDVIDEIQRDPHGCVAAYNRACEAVPDSGMRPLTLRDHLIELPLWRMRPAEPRLPVYASQLAAIPRDELYPRALLMTGVFRRSLCDLFFHGTGGAAYDRVTSLWFEQWLGATLAPMVMATATLTLALLDGPMPTQSDLDRARALAHRALHEPAVVGDSAAADAKRDLVARIGLEKAAGRNPGALFAQMHVLLESYRARNAAAIADLAVRGEQMASTLSVAELARDRTWPLPLLPADDVGRLRDEIRREIVGA